MLGHAAARIDLECLFVDPGETPPAATAGEVIRAAYDDKAALDTLTSRVDVVTYEFENVPVDAVDHLGTSTTVLPPAAALENAQDRLFEKRLFESLDIPVPGYRAVDSANDMAQAIAELGLPLILKTRRFGYDGKGQATIDAASDAEAAIAVLGGSGLIAEQRVPFDYEVSAIGARGKDGSIVVYPLTNNAHRGGILRVSRAPVDEPALLESATRHLHRLLEKLDYVGVLALEMFVVDGRLLANEIAPRVHNSGHWTIEGAITSQFENHMRAVAGLPLGSAEARTHAGMVNLIGELPERLADIEAAGGHVHLYGKSARPGRKLGHVTVVADTAAERDRLVDDILPLLPD